MGWIKSIVEKHAKPLIEERFKSINIITKKDYSNSSMVFKNSSVNFIQDKIDSNKIVGLEGLYYLDKSILANKDNITILSKLQGNKGLHFYTNKDINFIEVRPESFSKRGVSGLNLLGATFHHLGDTNKSVIDVSGMNKSNPINFNNSVFNFDYFGNKKTTVFKVDFDNSRWASNVTVMKFYGYWKNIDIAFDVKEKTPYMHPNGVLQKDVSNNFTIGVEIWGANMYYDFKGLATSDIKILGQHLYRDDKKLFNLDSEKENLVIDQFIYDVPNRGYKKNRGDIKCNILTVKGISTQDEQTQSKIANLMCANLSYNELRIL